MGHGFAEGSCEFVAVQRRVGRAPGWTGVIGGGDGGDGNLGGREGAGKAVPGGLSPANAVIEPADLP